MEAISNLTVKQVRIYGPDVIPFQALVTSQWRDYFKSTFSFESFSLTPENELAFAAGSHSQAVGEPAVLILFVIIGPRRITIQVAGNSKTTNEIFGLVLETLPKATPALPDALIMTEETISVVTLDFDWAALLSPPVANFLRQELVAKATSPEMTASIARVGVSVNLGFTKKDPLPGVTISPKVFFIEPRADVPLSERRYYTASPLDSDTHFGLLRSLERRLRKKQRRRSKR